jgi:hypothetical protein
MVAQASVCVGPAARGTLDKRSEGGFSNSIDSPVSIRRPTRNVPRANSGSASRTVNMVNDQRLRRSRVLEIDPAVAFERDALGPVMLSFLSAHSALQAVGKCLTNKGRS